jgi:glycosyltransferase involved in cell wall biosynthesis
MRQAPKKPSLSIITTCKGRLSHLKMSLPSFLAQENSEVIVVDYDCPDHTFDHVRMHFPSAKVLKVEDRPYFNNWEARNIGAASAAGDIFAFVDADTVISPDFSDWILKNINSGIYAKMPNAISLQFHKDQSLGPGSNRFEGLLILPKETFLKLEGYDDLLQGWGAGGDTDMVDRLEFHGRKRLLMPEALVERSITHSDHDRIRFHRMGISLSHLTGLLYRVSKNSLMRLFAKEISREERIKLYQLAKNAAERPTAQNSAGIELLVISDKVPASNYLIEQKITTKITWSG